MKNKLSIIIPCYNSEKTLEESVVSVYTQHLTIPFEIVMVDDGSSDGTKELIGNLAKKYKEVRSVFHERNKGGGAARNTGIKHADGDLIFCLDSDNFFPEHILQGMVNLLHEKKCDGVVIHDRRFFLGSDTKNYTSHINSMNAITFDSLFDGSDALLDNFLFTKESYLRTAGYPENHGFDTQCFEVRYLSTGPKVYVDKNSVFYHRQDPGQNSYFQRVYKKGDFSKNFYLIYEEVMHLFSPKVRLAIMSYDIFKNSKVGEQNIKSFIRSLRTKFGNDFYVAGYERLMASNGPETFYQEHKESEEVADMFVCAMYTYRQSNFKESLEYYNKIFASGLESPVLYFNVLRNYIALSGVYQKNEIEKKVSTVASSLLSERQKLTAAPAFVIGIANKFPILKKIFKRSK